MSDDVNKATQWMNAPDPSGDSLSDDQRAFGRSAGGVTRGSASDGIKEGISSNADTIVLVSAEIRYEDDVVLVRQRARQIAELLHFDVKDQTRIATSVSELARNAFEYAGGGKVTFSLIQPPMVGGSPKRQAFAIRVTDQGPGIADVQAVLDGNYVSRTGMGLGLVGARRLSELFRLDSAPGRGTSVEIARHLPVGTGRVGHAEVAQLVAELATRAPRGAFDELREQNRELLRTLEELRARQSDIERLNIELSETNRGVLALYTELDERAKELKLASEYKSRFLSDVSHELRTPLTSVLNMTRFLLARADGDLSSEQERQVHIIRKSMESLGELVNDLLDLAKIEAGRTTLRAAEFTLHDTFASLRGVFRPLLPSNNIELIFDVDADVPPMHTDELRLSQVLRNFISNAIKFTDSGEIRVSAKLHSEASFVRISVCDSGIGIAPHNHTIIFHDFTQVEGPIQRRVRGTGLGLPLSKKLAHLLGGWIELESAVGEGSTFTLIAPLVLAVDTETTALGEEVSDARNGTS
ncbi:MAG: ATP-binding protein [Gemmatimonadaceae bacterium]